MPYAFVHIRGLREDNDLRQNQLAAYLHVSQNTYSQYENGVIALTAETLIRLAKFYGVSVDYLLDLTDRPTYDGSVPQMLDGRATVTSQDQDRIRRSSSYYPDGGKEEL